MGKLLVTSESVTEGHPDKLCDQLSDGLLDAYLSEDPDSRVAIECVASNGIIFITGEVTSKADVDITAVARNIIEEVGYTHKDYGLDFKTCLIVTNINIQSPDIALGVQKAVEFQETSKEGLEAMGAGDQGIMYGYACTETDALMPLPIYLAHQLAIQLATLRKNGRLPYLRPDGKTQVTVSYDDNGDPEEITDIVISAQHDEMISQETIWQDVIKEVIEPIIPAKWLTSKTRFHINPTGRFVVGGPQGDTGLTGRKIIVDTYGGVARHGGGAFSGKDPSKVDRSAAYMARYVAKNIIAAGLAKKCEIAICYAIGKAEPLAINVNTFNTEFVPKDTIDQFIKEKYNFSVGAIINHLQLRQPIYRKTAAYGHFGRNDTNFPWERVDRA